jgi:GWxTD domain-containing protein
LKKNLPLALIAAVLLAAGLWAAPEKLTPEFERWLEDVSPIMTKAERAVFTKLQANADRAKFVRFFWRTRDPLPDTAQNEFQKEYEDRVRYADENFGRSSPKRGSQTDRGFFHLVLGKPLERTTFATQSQVWPLELWYYRGEETFGLPSYFYLIFYQPEGIGDYRLYSPSVEGPEKLAVPTLGSGVALTRRNAVAAIRAFSAELANASLSYLPSESPMGMSSFSSDTIIASVRNLPEKKFSDSYARSYMAFKDHVETEYTDNYIASAFEVRVFRESGQPFLHWSIEPEKMNFSTTADTIYASFELVLRLEDGRGVTVFERTEEIPEAQPRAVSGPRTPALRLPGHAGCRPGEYRALSC